MITMPFASQKLMSSPSLLRRRSLPSMDGMSQGASIASTVFWSVSQSDGPTLILSEKLSRKLAWSTSKIARFACNRVTLVSFSAGVKSRGIYVVGTFDIPSSLLRMFSTRSREMPTVSAV